MNTIKSIHIVYFTGTGGTALVAENMSNNFKNYGVDMSITELKKTEYVQCHSDFLIILYPVYDFGAPKPITEWIARTPAVNGIPAAVISVSGGGDISPNTACRTAVIKKLEKKGYNVLYENMIIMPSNVIVTYDDSISAMLLRKMPDKTKEIVSDILSGKRIRKNPLLLDRFLTKLGSIGRNYGKPFAKGLKVTNDCIGCSWCEKHCPRGNISMCDGKPVFGKDCVICLRCIYGCPKKAITVSGSCKILILKDGYNLKALEKRTSKLSELSSVSQIPKGYIYKGIKNYLNDNKK